MRYFWPTYIVLGMAVAGYQSAMDRPYYAMMSAKDANGAATQSPADIVVGLTVAVALWPVGFGKEVVWSQKEDIPDAYRKAL